MNAFIRTLGALAALSSFAVPALAAERMVIRNATLFDATGEAPYVADVCINGTRIVGVAKDLPIDVNTTEIDASGLALLPGLIDIHLHWTAQRQTTARTETAHTLLKHGITTSADFHAAPEAYQALRAWEATQVSPHTLYAARMSTPGGHGADWADINMTRTVTSAYEARVAAQTVLGYQPDLIKVFTDGWRYGSGIDNSSINENALTTIVEAAGGTPVVTHTVTVGKAKIAARAGVTAIVHAIQDADADDELVSLMKDNGVFYAPTLAVYEPRPDKLTNETDEQLARVHKRQRHSRNNLRRFYEAGVKIALGTDSGIASTPYGESTLRELELLVDFGLTPADALLAGTVHSAEAFSLDRDRGTIEVGKRGDLILVRGRPWDRISDVRNIEAVFIDGQLVVSKGKILTNGERRGLRVQPAPRVVDDFEREDRRTPNGALRLHNADSGHPRSVVLSYRVPRGRNNHALHLSARMSVKESPRAMVYLPLSPGNFFAHDLAGYRGVRFDVRGDGDYFVGLHRQADVERATFDAQQKWRTLKIEFDRFKSGGTEDTDEGQHAFGLEFGAGRQASHTFWVEVDNVEFY